MLDAVVGEDQVEVVVLGGRNNEVGPLNKIPHVSGDNNQLIHVGVPQRTNSRQRLKSYEIASRSFNSSG